MIRETPTVQLRPHQEEHFSRIVDILSRFYFYIDGSEMGTGKTYICASVATILNLPTIVICPVAARKTWQDVFTTYGIQCCQLDGKPGIISYECLRSKKGYQPKHGLLTRSDGETLSFAPTPLLTEIVGSGVLIIFDECQKLKNKSDQNKAAKVIVREIQRQNNCSRLAFLSASALDKQVQCVNFLRMVGAIQSHNLYSKINGEIRLEGIRDLHQWARKINNLAVNTFIYNNYDPSNQDEANKYIYDFFVEVIKPSLMSIMMRPNYNGAMKDVKNGYYCLTNEDDLEYQRGIKQLVDAVKFDPQTKTVVIESDNIGAITCALIRIQKAKMRAMVRIARQELAKPTTKVILFADYYEVIDFLLDELKEFKPVELTGRLSENTRNSNISEFQDPANTCRLLIGNPLVGGLSVNLHDTIGNAPRVMYIMPNYRINELHQATGRTFRDGIIGNAVIRFFYGLSASKVKEKCILDVLARKGAVMQNIHLEQGALFPNEYKDEYER